LEGRPTLRAKPLVQKSVLIPLLLLSPVLVFSLFAEVISPFDPLVTGVGPQLSPPSMQYLMGTDQLGSDIFSQVVYGSRTALYVGVISSLIALVIALALGIASGFYGGVLDHILMRITDLLLSIPTFVLLIIILIVYGSRLTLLTLVIGLLTWPTLARITRSQVLSLKERDFVLAAKGLGESGISIMIREILPNLWPYVIPPLMLQVGFAILVESGVSFLGLGDTSAASWGRSLWLASRAFYAGAWWGAVFPGLMISLTILSFNLMGDTLNRLLTKKE
jgi:peptide/nickel transport system permease protein